MRIVREIVDSQMDPDLLAAHRDMRRKASVATMP
jgi:hypothetical protein